MYVERVAFYVVKLASMKVYVFMPPAGEGEDVAEVVFALQVVWSDVMGTSEE